MSNLNDEIDTDELQKLFDETLGNTTSPKDETVPSIEAPAVPEQQTKPSDKAANPAVEDKPKEVATENQWKDSLPEEAKRHLDSLEAERTRLLNNWKIEQGRTAKALQEQREYKQKLEQAKQQATPVAAPQNDKLTELLAALEESDPAMAELLRGIREDTLSRAKAEQSAQLEHVVDKEIRPIYVAKEEEYIAEQKSIMDKECPNWIDVMKSPDFVEYIKHQPTFMQEAYHSSHAKDLLFMLRTYSNDVFGPEPAAPAAPARGGDPSEAEKVEQRRKDKLQRSVVPSNAPTQQKTEQLSEGQELEKLFAKALKGEI